MSVDTATIVVGRERLLGGWELEILRRFRDGVFHREPMGAGAKGRLIYDASGVMSAFLMSLSWERGEAAPHWSTFFSYSGPWALEGDTVTHHLDMCAIPQLIGTPLVRYVSFKTPDRMLLRTAAHTTNDGHRSHDELIWNRVSA